VAQSAQSGWSAERGMTMKKLRNSMFAMMAAIAIVVAAPASAQNTASVHGHVNDAAGTPVGSADVKFTTDKTSEAKDRKYPYSFPTDASGNYTGTGIPPGDYLVVVVKSGVQEDYQMLTLKSGDDKTLDFDMTREEYIKAMTPEQRKQLEDLKKKNSEAISANQVIAKLNATLKTVTADLDAAAPTKGDVSADVTMMKQAVDAKPDAGVLWVNYGNTLLAQGDHLASDDKKAGKPPMSDDAVLKDYSDATDAFKKGIDLESAGPKPSAPAAIAGSYNQMGVAFSHAGKVSDASAAFDGAAKTDPTKAGMYYNNEAVTLYNANQFDEALAAAKKAIAVDPNRPGPYYLEGQVLIQQSTIDPKTSKLVAPPGCIEAYEKFLDLAPNDPLAPTVREVLAGFSQTIDTKYRAGKK
jgi:tetratricopeptide (TPR) repeat protein